MGHWITEVQKNKRFPNAGVLICWKMNREYEKLTLCLPDRSLDNSKMLHIKILIESFMGCWGETFLEVESVIREQVVHVPV